MTPLVEIRDLTVRRGDFTLSIPQWAVPSGAVVGVVGENGAGKTTLLSVLSGERPAASGSVRVLGLDPTRDPVAVRQQAGFMSDDQAVFQVSVARLLLLVSGYYPTWDAALATALLTRFELDPARPAWRLSRGEGSRLRLVLAMASRPKVLVLDEPGAGLDLTGRRQLIRSVLEVAGEGDRSVVISSHQLADLERVADRLLVLSRGAVVAEGPTDEVVSEGETLEETLLRREVAR